MDASDEIDKYIAGFPDNTQVILKLLRRTIQEAAPDATEAIGYQMPAFKLKRILVYFAGYKNHIGFYPTASAIDAFKSEFSAYKWSKGTLQFALDQKLPVELIAKIVKFKVKEQLEPRKKM